MEEEIFPIIIFPLYVNHYLGYDMLNSLQERKRNMTSNVSHSPNPEFNPRRRRTKWERRRKHIFHSLLWLATFAMLGAAIWGYFKASQPTVAPPDISQPDASTVDPVEPSPDPQPVVPVVPAFSVQPTADTAVIPAEFPSQYAIVLDANTGEVLAQRDPNTPISPASMTKILTLLVAVENIEDWQTTCEMTRDMASYCYVNKCSVVGYEVGETIYAREALYGCILNSGADACLALAQIACGSHEVFVEKMNEKLEELGLSQTAHFTNCVGLYDETHLCTVQDIAIILRTALENEICRRVLTTKVFTTQPTTYHTSGQVLSNLFVRRIAKRDTGTVTVLGAKTGYVPESGFCAASYAQNEAGRELICVTGKSTSTWQSIYDHQQLYQLYGQ